MPGSLIDQRGGRRLMVIKIRWQFIDLSYRHCDIFCVRPPDRLAEQVPVQAQVIFAREAELTFPTSKIGIDHNVIPYCKIAVLHFSRTYYAIDCDDFSGAIRPIDVRQVEL